jgi:Sec-independent protein translocase protein TatA
VGFGADFLFIVALGALVLGPKEVHALIGRVAQVKSRFEAASRGFKSQLDEELDVADQAGVNDPSPEL